MSPVVIICPRSFVRNGSCVAIHQRDIRLLLVPVRLSFPVRTWVHSSPQTPPRRLSSPMPLSPEVRGGARWTPNFHSVGRPICNSMRKQPVSGSGCWLTEFRWPCDGIMCDISSYIRSAAFILRVQTARPLPRLSSVRQSPSRLMAWYYCRGVAK